MPLQQTSGAASYDAFGGGAPVAAKYIEDFFQSWLRTGTGSSTTVTTGLNASINKSLVWTKSRSAATNHKLTDTARGVTKALSSNTTGAEVTDSQGLTAFNSTGYTIGTNTDYNNSGATYVDWQLVATPKFFDVVTFTTDGSGNASNVSHNLSDTPGMILIKKTNGSQDWKVYHRSLITPTVGYLQLNDTSARIDHGSAWISVSVTTVSFLNGLLDSGGTYVAYLFAHNAGGFGLTGTDNVISCGSFTTDGSGNATVNLGYEPQWLTFKSATGVQNWLTIDTMRGWINNTSGFDAHLIPNGSNAETSSVDWGEPTATGFNSRNLQASATYIYIAIRRGPMRTPTTGTSVFEPVTTTSSANPLTVTTGFPVDLTIQRWTADGQPSNVLDRLRGGSRTSYARLLTTSTDAELTGTGAGIGFDSNTTEVDNGWISGTANKKIYWTFRRAPGFFDEVCYTGTGSARTVAHNLTVVPELMIVKQRNTPRDWISYNAPEGATKYMILNRTNASAIYSLYWNNTAPTNTVFTLGTDGEVNESGSTYVAYLFASCPGVSKVGSYTGTGTTQVINCGFTGGARFVLIKATSTTGNWLVWDSARGIVAGNDPYLALNSTAAEVTTTDWVDTAASGFELSNNAGNLANSNGVSYIFWAVA